MASPVQEFPAATAPPSADVVGNAFVLQYYHILEQSPELVHRFYQDTSKLGRPGDNGIMSITTTMNKINERILHYGKQSATIGTVDAQDSYNGGVLVLVTGYITGNANSVKKFTQSFFLAPQDKGYFVLNDVFRYVDDSTPQTAENGVVVDSGAPLSSESDSTAFQNNHVVEPVIDVSEDVVKEETYNPYENGGVSDEEEETPVPEVVHEIPGGSYVVADSKSKVETVSNSFVESESIPKVDVEYNSKVEAESNPKVEAESNPKVEAETNSKVEVETNSKVEVPKMSYASILKALKQSTVPLSAPAPASMRTVPKKQEHQVTAAPTVVPVSETVLSSTNGRENGNLEAEAEGPSIYIKGLPMNCLPALVENEFKKFGEIKHNGVQVRTVKGFWFGFVEYEAASSVQNAIEAAPIMIGNCQVHVEEKRSTRLNGRGRFSSARGNGNSGYRTEGARGRGGYGGGRGYGRGDFNFKSDFGGRSNNRGGSSGRGGDGYQRTDHAGRVSGAGGVAVSNAAAETAAPQVPASA